jgi:hypothetical protein
MNLLNYSKSVSVVATAIDTIANLYSIRRLIDLGKISVGAAMLAGVITSPALADPVPIGIDVFCFRFTDIKQSEGDPEDDRFEFEFESLNWTNMPAQGVFLSLNKGTGFGGVQDEAPFLDGAGVDMNGRPIGSESMRPPGNQDIENDWSVKSLPGKDDPFTKTAVRWRAGTPIDNIDLIGINAEPDTNTRQDLIDKVNERFEFDPDFDPPNPETGSSGDLETIDNGPNVRDGFTFALDDFDVGEVVSFNWFLEDDMENSIGTAGSGNAYGFGTINITRINPGDPLPGSVLQGNTGFKQTQDIFFDEVFKVKDADGNVIAELGAEFGAGVTAPFQNQSDNFVNAEPNTKPVPEPLTILGSGVALGFGVLFKRKVSRKQKKS